MASITLASQVWLHNALNLNDYVVFRFVAIDDAGTPQVTSFPMSDGSTTHLVAPGFEESVQVVIPFPSRPDFLNFRERIGSVSGFSSPLMYRDSRGRKWFGTVKDSGATENQLTTDVRSFSFTFTKMSWSEVV